MMTDVKQYSIHDYRLPEVRIRLAEGADTLYSTTPISSAADAAKLIGNQLLCDLDREMIVVVSLNHKMQALNYSIASMGTVSESLAHPREIMKSAVLSNASGILILHNHPSGDITPSQPDLDFTAKVSAAGKLLDIPLIDHVIIGGGNGQHYSLAEHNQLGSTGNGFTVSENKGTYHISRKDRVADLTEKLKTGVADYLSSDSYKQLLNALAKFHRYSLNNSILIAMQNPGASQVASYSTWQSLNRQVNAGEKGIQILCPTPYKRKTSTEQIDDAQKSPVMDEQGSIVKAEPEVQYLGFRIGHVFDISQTSQIPGTEEIALSPVQELSGDVRRYDDIIRAITEISPVHIRFERFVGSAKGYFSSAEQEIVIKPDMSQAQTVKTLVHETCHSRIHNPLSQDSDIKQLGFSREDAEIQAESVAFITCSYLNDRYDLGLDTSSYSFPYVASWAGTPDKILPNLSVIKMAAEDLIGQIDMVMSQIKNDHIAEQHLFDKVIQTQPAKHLSL